MMRAAFLLLFILTDRASCKKTCSYQDVVDYLNLTTDTGLFRLTRPVRDHRTPTTVQLDIILYAILAVIEKTQTFIPFVWATVKYHNEFISWEPAQFCGITQVSIPQELLWKPDLFIFEMVQKDDSPQNPNIVMHHDGMVQVEQDLKVVSTCKMDVHKFPFDTQSCSISIGSSSHCAAEIKIIPSYNSSRATQFSREMMKTQGEWEFLQLSISRDNFTFDGKLWEQLSYTFTIKRRPLLHVINFLLPIVFFLTLDLASFFISDHRGEKLSFKVTVLLAISVLLLILNDILPSMSNRTPLIATYCIVIFALMLLSLLETILVTYLIDKESQDTFGLKDSWLDKQEAVKAEDKCEAEDIKQNCVSCICSVSDGEKQPELLPAVEEVNNSVRSGESHVLLLILEELKNLQETLNLHLSSKNSRGKSAQWAARINRVFFIFYVITVALFLCFINIQWNS